MIFSNIRKQALLPQTFSIPTSVVLWFRWEHIVAKMVLLLFAAAFSSTVAQAAGIEILKGRWVSSTPETGQIVTFPKQLSDYATLLPGFQTQALIRNIDGHNGAQIKVVSQLGLVCYYAVAYSKNKMTWDQRDGGSNCPSSIVLVKTK